MLATSPQRVDCHSPTGSRTFKFICICSFMFLQPCHVAVEHWAMQNVNWHRSVSFLSNMWRIGCCHVRNRAMCSCLHHLILASADIHPTRRRQRLNMFLATDCGRQPDASLVRWACSSRVVDTCSSWALLVANSFWLRRDAWCGKDALRRLQLRQLRPPWWQ